MKTALLLTGMLLSFMANSQSGDTISGGEKRYTLEDIQRTDLHPSSILFDFRSANLDLLSSTPYMVYTPAYKTQGWFCKMEYHIETRSRFAPRFRLGSLNYTEWMEGKKPLYMRYWY